MSVIVGSIFGVLLTILLLRWTDMGAFLQQIKTVEPLKLCLYVLLSVVSYYLRAWRFQLLVGCRGYVGRLYSVVSVHTFLVNLLPFSSGDLTFPVLLKKYGISKSFLEGVPSLVLARVQDILVTATFLIVASVWLGLGDEFNEVIYWVIVIIGGLSVVAWGVFVGAKWCWNTRRGWYEKVPGIAFVTPVFEKIIESVRVLSGASILGSVLLSYGARIASVTGTYFLINGIGILMDLPVTFS